MEAEKIFTAELLDAFRLVGDPPADQFIAGIFENPDTKQRLYEAMKRLSDNASLKDFTNQYSEHRFPEYAGQLPRWADKKQLRHGAAFFSRNSRLIMNLLGLLSLPYCYTAADGAMVLYLSDRLRTDAGRRLYETADFVWEVMAPNAFDHDGNGFVAVLKVRLMHAAARFYTLKSSKWDLKWGIPVNQEDMTGTNLSFSLIVIRGLRKFGLTISYDDQQAFMHLWNVIGYLLGLDQKLIPDNGKEAFALEEAIRLRHFKPSEHGQALAKSLMNYFTAVNTGGQFSNAEIMQLMRYLLGEGIADMLQVPKPGLSVNKIRLLKAKNFIEELRPQPSTAVLYKNEYFKFRKNKPGNVL